MKIIMLIIVGLLLFHQFIDGLFDIADEGL